VVLLIGTFGLSHDRWTRCSILAGRCDDLAAAGIRAVLSTDRFRSDTHKSASAVPVSLSEIQQTERRQQQASSGDIAASP
jgi:hypothetical protein